MSILGMPLDAWALLVAAVGLGLGLELAFIRARRAHGVTSGAAGEGTRAGPAGVDRP